MWKPGRGDWRSAIAVVPLGDGDPKLLSVTVEDSGTTTTHEVTVSSEDSARRGAPSETSAEFVHRCFEFLLDREPKESILRRFDVSIISTYFPELEDTIAHRKQEDSECASMLTSA